ncbi:MAG: glycosyltransferase family 4 protein [Opitutaceae bacterium]
MSASLRTLPATPDAVVLFVGSDHGPNQEGLNWFLREVWPVVYRETPAARLLIAGGICEALPEKMPQGVVKLGRVPDMATAYAQASVIIAPILRGSGLKIKLLEAIGFGRACVTTSVGAEGFEALREGLSIANSAAEFARVTCELLRDPAKAARSGAALQDQARVHLSPEACYGPLVGMLLALDSARKI